MRLLAHICCGQFFGKPWISIRKPMIQKKNIALMKIKADFAAR
jgi:hypothetical protein